MPGSGNIRIQDFCVQKRYTSFSRQCVHTSEHPKMVRGRMTTQAASGDTDFPSSIADVETQVDKTDEDNDVLIEFRDVHKGFGSKKILKGASFKIRRGEAVGIIGSSGTGKSTTLRLAAGLLEPDSVRCFSIQM